MTYRVERVTIQVTIYTDLEGRRMATLDYAPESDDALVAHIMRTIQERNLAAAIAAGTSDPSVIG